MIYAEDYILNPIFQAYQSFLSSEIRCKDKAAIFQSAEFQTAWHWVRLSLANRELDILELRYQSMPNAVVSLRLIAKINGVTPERIRQIEQKAFRKLRHPHRWQLVSRRCYEIGLSELLLKQKPSARETEYFAIVEERP